MIRNASDFESWGLRAITKGTSRCTDEFAWLTANLLRRCFDRNSLSRKKKQIWFGYYIKWTKQYWSDSILVSCVDQGRAQTGSKGVKDRVGPQQERNIWLTLIDHLQRQDKLPIVAFTLSRSR